MRWVPLVLVVALFGCGPQEKTGTGPGADAAPFPAAQAVIDRVAAGHPNLTRLTLHAVPEGKTECTQIASTMPERRGKLSDPEDMKAMKTGEEIVLEEPGALDVTVPILMVDGKPTAIAGVTLKMEEGADREALLKEARAVAKELEKAVQAAGKPLW